LLEKQLKDGTYLVCPNNKKTASAEEPKRRGKKKLEPEETGVRCDYSKLVNVPEAVA
jgi:hypothetical protein